MLRAMQAATPARYVKATPVAQALHARYVARERSWAEVHAALVAAG